MKYGLLSKTTVIHEELVKIRTKNNICTTFIYFDYNKIVIIKSRTCFHIKRKTRFTSMTWVNINVIYPA